MPCRALIRLIVSETKSRFANKSSSCSALKIKCTGRFESKGLTPFRLPLLRAPPNAVLYFSLRSLSCFNTNNLSPQKYFVNRFYFHNAVMNFVCAHERDLPTFHLPGIFEIPGRWNMDKSHASR